MTREKNEGKSGRKKYYGSTVVHCKWSAGQKNDHDVAPII